MTVGRVEAGGDAVVRLVVQSPSPKRAHRLEAVLDTGRYAASIVFGERARLAEVVEAA